MPGLHDQGQTMPGLHDQGQTMPGLHDQGQTMPGFHEQGQTMPGLHDQGQTMPGLHDRGQIMPGLHDQGQTMPMAVHIKVSSQQGNKRTERCHDFCNGRDKALHNADTLLKGLTAQFSFHRGQLQ